jgi:hypothetical protein
VAGQYGASQYAVEVSVASLTDSSRRLLADYLTDRVDCWMDAVSSLME